MKSFEISSMKNKNGRRNFKAVLYRIFPDSCVDDENQVGTEYNRNGITFIREYCERALPSISGMSLRCEFTDEERTQLCGHGDTGVVDGEPVFEDAVVIGTFTRGYIDDIETEDGVITACIGEGEIDAQCYHNFVKKLEDDISHGIFPCGSVEIMHTANNKEIIYKYGYKDVGRIPMEFIHSGYALLGVLPADDNAKLIELNKKHEEELEHMNELEMKTLVSQVVSELSRHEAEINECKRECDEKLEEAQTAVETAVNEKNAIEAESAKIRSALESLQAELEDMRKKYDELYNERCALEKALAEAQARERIGEMNTAIAQFDDTEKAYAQTEIDAFHADPMAVEINSIVNKIWEGIGKASRENEKRMAEQNSAQETVEDIFSEVETTPTADEDVNIF